MVVITTDACMFCRRRSLVRMPEDAYDRWHNQKMLLQKAWPEGSRADRELLLTGTDSECWEKFMSDEGDEEVT